MGRLKAGTAIRTINAKPIPHFQHPLEQGDDKPASKSSPFVFHQNCLFSPPATTHCLFQTLFRKTKSFSKAAKWFFSTGELLCSVSDCIGFCVIYLFHLFLLLQEKQPELWGELIIQTSRNMEMLRKAVLSCPSTMLSRTSVWMWGEDLSRKWLLLKRG